jgi:hypothetical protein
VQELWLLQQGLGGVLCRRQSVCSIGSRGAQFKGSSFLAAEVHMGADLYYCYDATLCTCEDTARGSVPLQSQRNTYEPSDSFSPWDCAAWDEHMSGHLHNVHKITVFCGDVLCGRCDNGNTLSSQAVQHQQGCMMLPWQLQHLKVHL